MPAGRADYPTRPRRIAWVQRAALLAAVWAGCASAVGDAQEPLPVMPTLPSPPMADAAGPALAAEKPSRSLVEALETHGDLTLQNGTLKSALFTIGEQWGINIVTGEIDGAVNGVFRDAPLREILDSILLSNGYGYRPVGQSLVVTRLSELGQVNPFFVSETIPIAVADVNEVVQGASLLSTPNGQVRAIPSARAVVVLDFADRVEKIREFIKAIDAATARSNGTSAASPNRPLEVAYLKTHHVTAQDMLELLSAVMSSAGKATVLPREDRLLVVDYPENVRMVREVVAHADRPRPQVVIQALIYDISLQDLEELGLNWHSVSNGNLAGATISGGGGVAGSGALNAGTGTLINSVTKVPFADGAAGGAFTLYNLSNNFSMAAVAMALQNAADSRLLASPNVTVVENELATIQSVSEIPYQQLTQTAAGGNIGTTAFKEAGITLNVTPKIGMDGTIQMQVSPEFSRLTGFTPGDNQPIIDKRIATTHVRIANGHTFVIGGLRQRSDVGDFKGIPFLKDVRFIGPLFRSHETDIRESELMVFIRPTIVGCAEPLCEREQRTADTVDCRLERIPAAEGCPGGCASASDCGSASLGPEPYYPTEAGGEPYGRTMPHNPSLRRLPPIGDAQAQPADGFAGGLRRGYDARYRAANAPQPATPEPEEKGKRSSFIGRLWR
ncbi:Type II secretion system protein D precursor [Posidoniimonas polymericola]|uniref:Type II secretion system protein D n=1 Tax=Posidoniimonas polymericola TaxID=2528002 RepID=A0A5C5XSS5_9BACT|nr:secretin N-terminal domain-containing protein [Posidoniimonas polymericola]TWT66306.1 Type II secretion system protein D precursor [Posidoniimonas polymericola]